MTSSSSSSAPIRSANPWLGVLLLIPLNGFFLGMLFFATRAFLPQPEPADPWLPVFLGFMWIGVLWFLVNSTYAALTGLRNGRSTLRLDHTPMHVGGWASGVVEAPERLQGADVFLFVECVKTYYALKIQRNREWQTVKLLDGARLERQSGAVLIPFAVLLPENGQPTADDTVKRIRFNWSLRVQANVPGLDYDVAFELAVQPREGMTAAGSLTPARSMPELQPEQVATQLEGAFELVGDARVMRLPFPMRLATATALFAAVPVALTLLGFAGSAALDEDVRLGLAAVSAGVALVLALVLMFAPRAIEVRPETVTIRRGMFGLGVHKTIATRDIAAVEETVVSIEDTVGGYGVALKTRDGKVHAAVNRLRNPTQARALAGALTAVLPRA